MEQCRVRIWIDVSSSRVRFDLQIHREGGEDFCLRTWNWSSIKNRGVTIQYVGGLRSRELGQAPMLLVFLFSKAGIIISLASVFVLPVGSSHLWQVLQSGKVCLRCKGKTVGHCQQIFENKKFVDITQQCFALLPQVNFPANNLNFHWRWRWWDWIQPTFLNLFYFNLTLTFLFFIINNRILIKLFQKKPKWQYNFLEKFQK